jgi:GTP-binding protein
MIAGSSNSGKTSLINALNDNKNVGKVSKRSGKTESINFYKGAGKGMILDSPGYGYTAAPVKLKN